MRKLVIAGILGLIAINGAFVLGDAFAQSGGQQHQKGKDKGPPPPAPPPRCADLGVGSATRLTAVPGEAPLGEHEIAVRWDVHNDGTAPYVSTGVADQSVALEFMSPGGVHQIASTQVPANAQADGGVTLAQGDAWHGYIRAQLPPEARGRRLRLRLVYAADGFHRAVNDCDTTNNTVSLAPLTP